VVRALAIAVALVSIDTGAARSQGTEAPEDDETSGGRGAGGALVAPTDPKARAAWLRDKLTAAITARPQLAAKAKIGVYVATLEGTELYAREADAGLNLASNAKVVTAASALALLGGGFRWRTAAYVDDLDETTGVVKGNLYLRGRGDPTLTAADLRALATDLAARGVRDVKGQLVIDGAYFDGDFEPPHFTEQPKERAAFRAPVASLGVARSAVTVNVIAEPGGKAKAWLEPDAGDYVKLVKADVKSVAVGRTRLRVDVKPKPDQLEIEVVGEIRAADGHWWIRRRVDDPQRFAAEVFRRMLAERGVKIAKRAIGSGPVPVGARLVATRDSAPLSTIIRDMNKASDNYVAEAVLKTLGAESRGTPAPATWGDGLAAIGVYLATLGLPPGSYRIGNGSGLFAATEVSPRQMVTLLRGAHADYRIGPDLVASLPVGGLDGTLARRWNGSAARGRVRAKTGSLNAVTTLAGFVGVEGHRPLVFAILVNDIAPGHKPYARTLADEMLEVMVAYLDGAGPR
jgi:serine-type D-Ala-D-Ala carboxypeptidase/endopeptidase (penicillin-binding protein 4)